jgi:hypothetical protein
MSTPTPCVGTIVRYEPGDQTGAILTEHGTTVAFGASGCRGFSPAVGAVVQVTGVREFPIVGERATGVERAPEGTRTPKPTEPTETRPAHRPPPGKKPPPTGGGGPLPIPY